MPFVIGVHVPRRYQRFRFRILPLRPGDDDILVVVLLLLLRGRGPLLPLLVLDPAQVGDEEDALPRARSSQVGENLTMKGDLNDFL